MILTPVAVERIGAVAALFRSNLRDRTAQAAFARVAKTGPQRADGARAETHRLGAARLARRLGIEIRPGSPTRGFGWDGQRMRSGTEAYVLLHEIAHWQLADQRRRRAFEFGLGPGPETGLGAAARRAAKLVGLAQEHEEAMASLLGILWETELGQPALASLLDQNWLEGAARPGAARHFEATLARLRRAGLVDPAGRPMIRQARRTRSGA